MKFVEVARDVYVLRYPQFDVNATLVLGDGEALLVDTLSNTAQAGELAVAARSLTTAPWTIVNTHHHFDHCLGNAALSPVDIWAHEETAAVLRDDPDRVRREWPESADTPVLAPNRTVLFKDTVDIGGRRVVLRHLGRGHTAGDLIVGVPDADLLVAGDLVEESGPPQFDDAYPLEWPETLAALLRLCSATTVVIPGHGAAVDRDFVARQHADLVRLEWLIRDAHADNAPVSEVTPLLPWPSATAVRRGYTHLDR